jgi:pimeloyl-ACP methyl ester carboxylesterase
MGAYFHVNDDGQVERITEPVLAVVRDCDQHVPVEEVVTLYRWLPRAELAILPGTSHFRPMGDPAAFAHSVVDFLRRH